MTDPLAEPEPNAEPDFPSGEWTGFYQQASGRYRQDLYLRFAGGNMTGSGTDGIGRFTIRGRYDAESKEVWWTKRYLGGHDVYYRGFREIKGIWGTWDIGGYGSGFHIWPKSEGEFEAISLEAEIEEPVAVGPPHGPQTDRDEA